MEEEKRHGGCGGGGGARRKASIEENKGESQYKKQKNYGKLTIYN